jgi:hypothetical protein
VEYLMFLISIYVSIYDVFLNHPKFVVDGVNVCTGRWRIVIKYWSASGVSFVNVRSFIIFSLLAYDIS